MHVGAAEVLRLGVLADGGLHQVRPGQVEAARPFDDERFVRHDRQVGPARDARPHDGRDLRDAHRRHHGVVAEDPPEVLLVGEDLGLHREEDARRVDQVDDRQPVFHRNFLRPEVFLGGDRKPGPRLHGGVVRHDHDVAAVDLADPEDGARGGGAAVLLVHFPRGEQAHLQEVAVRVDEPRDPLAGGHLPAGVLLLDRVGPAAELHVVGADLEHPEEVLEVVLVLVELQVALDGSADGAHGQDAILFSSCRAMTIFWISVVPSPIVATFTSR